MVWTKKATLTNLSAYYLQQTQEVSSGTDQPSSRCGWKKSAGIFYKQSKINNSFSFIQLLLCFNNHSTNKQENGDIDGANKAKCVSHTEDGKEDWNRLKDGDKLEDKNGHDNVNMEDFISILDTQ